MTMTIRQAKEEILHTIKAYTAKNEAGSYRIAPVRQRPILLIGPPGIGKTAIVEQAAAETGLPLVAYTITHHTRQSAVGLPVISHKLWQGREYTVTEYTMSEIIGKIHDTMESTGSREGILFIDEINCVSETLLPTMLQLLQSKRFGEYYVPEGWVIVTAGNPKEYNTSVREFDMVTLDRVKKITVTADYETWVSYACAHGIHGSVLFYLDGNPGNFYHIHGIGDDRQFLTARGWEDLSVIIKEYERLEIPITEDLVEQYLQCPEIAADYYSWYLLYQKNGARLLWKAIWEGTVKGEEEIRALTAVKEGTWEERLCTSRYFSGKLVSLLTAQQELTEENEKVKELWEQYSKQKGALPQISGNSLTHTFHLWLQEQKNIVAIKKEQGLLKREEEILLRQALYKLGELYICLGESGLSGADELQRAAESWLAMRKEKEETCAKKAVRQCDRILKKLYEALGETPEFCRILSALAVSPPCILFLISHSCESWQKYLPLLQLGERKEKLRKELEIL